MSRDLKVTAEFALGQRGTFRLVFRRFETLVHPYPDALPPPPPRRFFRFMWECTRGMRRLLLLVTLLSAAIGSFEALLFSMMAHLIDALAQTPRLSSGCAMAAC